MLTVISPAKNLNYNKYEANEYIASPHFLKEAELLNKKLRKLKPTDIADLMKLSPKLAQLNYERYQDFTPHFTVENAKPAALAFNGEVYTGLDAESLDNSQVLFAQNNLRILSGLYGILAPMDLMQPYRLEMGTRFKTSATKKNLYQFWGDKITNYINEIEGETLINLASTEYFKSINKKKLTANVITPHFKDNKNGTYKVIMMYAKKARGKMARYIIENEIKEGESLKGFNIDGYMYNEKESLGSDWVFTRG